MKRASATDRFSAFQGRASKKMRVDIVYLMKACGIVAQLEISSDRLGLICKTRLDENFCIVLGGPIEATKGDGDGDVGIWDGEELPPRTARLRRSSAPAVVLEPRSAMPRHLGMRYEMLAGYNPEDFKTLNDIANIKERARRVLQHFMTKEWFPSQDVKLHTEYIERIFEACEDENVAFLPVKKFTEGRSDRASHSALNQTTSSDRRALWRLLAQTGLITKPFKRHMEIPLGYVYPKAFGTQRKPKTDSNIRFVVQNAKRKTKSVDDDEDEPSHEIISDDEQADADLLQNVATKLAQEAEMNQDWSFVESDDEQH
eukprot:TRINITY_DN3552_c0_g3_i1.p2 TRINITY_DN3552_c0_g3~~TRINITY_DN3552_c0_g3_i1.p2  ORF type:complete len:315 (-),score=66.59 TRINITY_DN3552_c0_g3_i1:65-1009(-)